MEGAGAPEQAGGARAGAEGPGRGRGGLGQAGIPPQAQVIVGTHIHPGGGLDGPVPAQGLSALGLLLEAV
jgi:hypothetical protein